MTANPTESRMAWYWRAAIAIAVLSTLVAVFYFLGGFSFDHNADGVNVSIKLGPMGKIDPKLGSAAGVIISLLAVTIGAGLKPGGSFANNIRSVSRSEDGHQIGGVCAGLGKTTAVPTWLWRVGFLVLAFSFGSGVLAYILLWMALPSKQ